MLIVLNSEEHFQNNCLKTQSIILRVVRRQSDANLKVTSDIRDQCGEISGTDIMSQHRLLLLLMQPLLLQPFSCHEYSFHTFTIVAPIS